MSQLQLAGEFAKICNSQSLNKLIVIVIVIIIIKTASCLKIVDRCVEIRNVTQCEVNWRHENTGRLSLLPSSFAFRKALRLAQTRQLILGLSASLQIPPTSSSSSIPLLSQRKIDLHQPPKSLHSGVLLPIKPFPCNTPIQNTHTHNFYSKKSSIHSGVLLLTGQ